MHRPLCLLMLGFATTIFPLHAAEIESGSRMSGFETMSPDLQAMQRDDFSNPAMLAVREGEALWLHQPAGSKPSCSGCHGDVATTMKGVAARFPAISSTQSRPVDLAGQIQQCQTERQGVAAAPRESGSLLALEALIALQSRGMPITPPRGPHLDQARARGRTLFNQRMGQLDLSCAQCHNDNWGKVLGGTRIPQGHPTGYPIFRIEWQATGSLQRRLRNCLTGIRAEPFPPGAPELIDLEAYLMDRAAGMAIDAPAIRP